MLGKNLKKSRESEEKGESIVWKKEVKGRRSYVVTVYVCVVWACLVFYCVVYY